MSGTIDKTTPARRGRPSLPAFVATAVAGAAAAAVGSAIENGWFGAEDTPRPSAAAMNRPTAPSPVATQEAHPARTVADVPSKADAVDAYAAMRDDVNPKPRLRLIDDWARRPHPDGDVALLSQALVDPDASVRERAQVLFDRAFERR